MAFNFMPTISFIYLLVVLASTALSLSHDEECLALFEFKQSLFYQDNASFDASGFQKSDSWRKIKSINASDTGEDTGDSDCCLWGGVMCSIEGQVIGLDLSQSSLHGSIKSNSTLFNLVHLQMLNLSMNYFSESQIPFEIARLQKLRILNLSDAGFSGQIPNEISHLMQLTSLDLSRNPLKLQSTSLEYLLQNLTRLEQLNLAGIDVSSSLPRFLANFSSLRSINLGDCQLQGEFPSELFHLPKLKFLRLRNNTSLTGSLPEFYNNTILEYLNLFSTGFAGIIPESISNLNHLEYLALGNCSFSGRIPGSLSNLTQLTRLSLESNKFIGSVSSLESLSELIHLNLSDNSFSGKLDLDMFVGLNKLKILDLGHNGLSCVATNDTEGTLPELKLLQLASCNLKEFPPFLRFQKNLNFLFLSHNKIEGLVPEWIWNDNQETLKMIDISYNFITGFHQHPKFFPWESLQTIQISYNHLHGELLIPPLTTIVYDASNNNFTGEIPLLICERKSLQYLDLSSNNMIGTLPPCLGNLSSSLSVLDLKQNKFHGPMMNTFMYGSPLKRIDMSENQFTGQLSKSLANCTNLQVLALGDNSFSDVFPFWLGNLANLQVLILRSNKFYGEIQDLSANSSQFQKLRILDLSNNSFGGQLPKSSFRNWNAMKSVNFGKSSAMQFEIALDSLEPYQYLYSMTLTNKGVKREYERILTIFIAIDLSSNNFEGEIPESLQDLQGLESLNLSNNHLSGRILPSLGNLKHLEALDLSQNEISGEIPQQLLQLGFLAMFNVSFNHLEGRIPQGKQFNTFDSSSYKGNPGLCGQPLSKDCQSSTASTTAPTSNHYESLLPSEGIDWIFVFSGVGSGMLIGIVLGNILHAKFNDRFIDRSRRKDTWVVGPLSSWSTN